MHIFPTRCQGGPSIWWRPQWRAAEPKVGRQAASVKPPQLSAPGTLRPAPPDPGTPGPTERPHRTQPGSRIHVRIGFGGKTQTTFGQS